MTLIIILLMNIYFLIHVVLVCRSARERREIKRYTHLASNMLKNKPTSSRIVVVGMKPNQCDAATGMDGDNGAVVLNSLGLNNIDSNNKDLNRSHVLSDVNSALFSNNDEVVTTVCHTINATNSSSISIGSNSVTNRARQIRGNDPRGLILKKKQHKSLGSANKKKKIAQEFKVKDEPVEQSICSEEEPEGSNTDMSIEVTNTDFLEVFDKALGDVSTMFKRIDDDPFNYVECTVCFKKIKESSMKQHFRTHAGLRPYPCDQCGTRFTRRSDVYRHKRVVHKKVKPYVCKMCFKTFPIRNLLLVHLLNHDIHVNYECETCGYKFGKKEYYDSHTRFIHPSTGGPKTVVDREAIVEAQIRELEEEDESLRSLSVNDASNRLTAAVAADKLDEEEANEYPEEEEDDEEEEDEDVFEEAEDMAEDIEVKAAESSFSAVPASVELQGLSKKHSRDEDLVHKILEAAVHQAHDTLQSLAAAAQQGSNKANKSNNNKVKQQKQQQQHQQEVMVKVSVSGELKRFHIRMSMEQQFNLLSEAGMELIVGMVNELCAGKGELDGPIEVELHKTGQLQASPLLGAGDA